ncbi:pectinesterase 3 isoform X2 [Coffea arabica]|uniref:Pectinesterase 3 isoform X2 n=1 Tax=Coffea arabica TaxID=13443 RepID=A0A6P6XFI0_COFAR|nr:pectinesterase 3-like [Coffea arabica]
MLCFGFISSHTHTQGTSSPTGSSSSVHAIILLRNEKHKLISHLTKIRPFQAIMDSVNDSLMASSKVSLLQHHPQQPSSSRNLLKTYKTLIIIISFCFIILASLILSTIILFHMHNRNNYNLTSEPTESLWSNSANLKTFCSVVSQDPDLCFTSISSSIKGTETDPDDIFAVSIKVAIDNVTSLAPLMREVLLSRTGAEWALKHCTESVADSLSQLNRSLTAVQLGAKENRRVFSSEAPVDLGVQPLTADRRGYVMTWLIRAMSGLDSCVDVLDNVGSVAVDELSVKVYKARVQVSNSREFLLYKDKILEYFVIHPAGVEDRSRKA